MAEQFFCKKSIIASGPVGASKGQLSKCLADMIC